MENGMENGMERESRLKKPRTNWHGLYHWYKITGRSWTGAFILPLKVNTSNLIQKLATSCASFPLPVHQQWLLLMTASQTIARYSTWRIPRSRYNQRNQYVCLKKPTSPACCTNASKHAVLIWISILRKDLFAAPSGCRIPGTTSCCRNCAFASKKGSKFHLPMLAKDTQQ